MQSRSRLEDIDCAKGIGILLVVIGHHLLGAESINTWINSFHMPLFFIISGYLFEHHKGYASSKCVLISKAKSLMWPYITFSTVAIMWYVLFYCILGISVEETLKQVLVKTVTTYGYHALWFLPAMFWTTVVSQTFGKTKRHMIFLLIGTICGGIVISGIIYHTEQVSMMSRYFLIYAGRVLIAISFMEIGKFLYYFIENIHGAARWVAIVCILISVIGSRFNINVNIALSRIGKPLLFYINACAGSISVLLISKVLVTGKIAKPLMHLGRNSLIIMAMHMDFPIEMAWIVLGKLKVGVVFSTTIASIFAIVIEFLIMWCLIKLINQHFRFMIQLPVNKNNSQEIQNIQGRLQQRGYKE